ncbi:chemotaxis protein [Paenibacillus mesophilus]|uniref:globin-coupled sensor protein n=1 Tax=Paenibacillus mesophilus TaxID=2582849 RepID=UPI00110D2FAA|nr:globin-coupled sensor protein [Paenibacillus mesophilus]TMV44472.1 chemotaxis protein [Paenibacillus mesophilus]
MKKCPYHAVTSLFKKKSLEKSGAGLPFLSEGRSPDSDSGPSGALLGSPELNAQLKMIDLTENDLRIIRRIQPFILEHIDDVVDEFYKTVIDVNGLRTIIEKHSTVERLRETLRHHLTEMFGGKLDDEFVQKRLKIAEVHQRIGLEPKWYMGAFQNLQNTFLSVILPYVRNSEESLLIGRAITKLLNFEQQLVLEAYEKKNTEQRSKQYEQIKRELKLAISEISQELAAVTEQTDASTQELAAASGQVNRSVAHSAGMAVESRRLADTGTLQVTGLQARIDTIMQSSLHVEKAVAQLKEFSRQIGGIVTIVKDISAQTNLLSLNASIEAARAGTHGAGFSVVAREVKKLSEDTRDAVSRISRLIEQSNEFTQQAVDSMLSVRRQVEAGQRESVQTGETFAGIVRSLESGLAEIGKAEKEMQSLSEAIKQVGDATHRAAASAERLDGTMRNY